MSIEAVDSRARGLRPRREAQAVGIVASALRVDWILLGTTVALVAYGLRAIDGITRHEVGGSLVGRQSLYAGVGLVLMIAVTLIDPRVYCRYRNALYVAALGVLGLVLVAGAVTRGSRRWIDVGFFQFQPSEFAQILFVIFVAGFLVERAKRIGELAVPLQAILLAAPAILLVFAEPDFGTALVYTAGLGAVLFVTGTRWVHLAAIGVVTLVGVLAVLWWLPSAGVNVLTPYQAARLTGFTHPGSDPRDATYNSEQSIVAVGDGGLRGRGVAGATQTRLHYLPEHATDFAFASLAEQRGFLGASFLLLLYLLVVWRGLRIVTSASDLFSAAVAGGLVFMFLFQIYVNVGMAIGIAPITGIPLPFVSVGGSSMITILIAIGILQAIHIRGGRRRA